MFIKLKDGRVINALDVSIVKPFNAQAELADSPFSHDKTEAGRKYFLEKNEKFHARVFLASAKGHYLGGGGMLIEETPEEFQETANSQLRKYGFKPEL